MANYYFTIPDSVTLPTDGNKVSLTTDCELHRDDSALPNALTVAADSYNVFLADTPGTGTATVPATAPAAFTAGQWTAATGTGASEIDINITTLPSDGGSSITALQYSVDSGTTWANLTGTGTGSRTIDQHSDGTTGTLTAATSYNIEVRAVNAVGNGADSDTKATTTGAAVAAFTDNFSGFTTGDDLGVDTTNYAAGAGNYGAKFAVTASDTAGMETTSNGGRYFEYIGSSPSVQNTDHFAEVEVTDIGSGSDSGHNFYVIVRSVDEDNWVGMRFYQNRMVGIYRRDAGSSLSNPSASLETPATDVNPITSGDVFKIEAVGDTVTVYRNGSSICSWTHSDLDTGGAFETGKPGLMGVSVAVSYNTPFRIEYFKCGNA